MRQLSAGMREQVGKKVKLWSLIGGALVTVIARYAGAIASYATTLGGYRVMDYIAP
jgi:hypothetical protein